MKKLVVIKHSKFICAILKIWTVPTAGYLYSESVYEVFVISISKDSDENHFFMERSNTCGVDVDVCVGVGVGVGFGVGVGVGFGVGVGVGVDVVVGVGVVVDDVVGVGVGVGVVGVGGGVGIGVVYCKVTPAF